MTEGTRATYMMSVVNFIKYTKCDNQKNTNNMKHKEITVDSWTKN